MIFSAATNSSHFKPIVKHAPTFLRGSNIARAYKLLAVSSDGATIDERGTLVRRPARQTAWRRYSACMSTRSRSVTWN